MTTNPNVVGSASPRAAYPTQPRPNTTSSAPRVVPLRAARGPAPAGDPAASLRGLLRIIDVFPVGQQGRVRSQLALTLGAVVSQLLLPRIKRGRAIAAEVMIGPPAVANLIRESRHHQIPSVMTSGVALGMRTMDQALADLVLTSQVSADDAFLAAHDHKLLGDLIRRDASTWAPASASAATNDGWRD